MAAKEGEELWGDTLNESETSDKKETTAAPVVVKVVLGAALNGVEKQVINDTQAEEDDKEDKKESAESTESVDDVAKELAETKIENQEEPVDNDSLGQGIHPDDQKAEVDVKAGKGVDLNIYKAAKSFAELGLSKELLDGINAKKFVNPSKIQAQALPIILARNRPNLIGQAHHGSGKTAVYSLGILTRVDPDKHHPQAICICPVRELATQVYKVVTELGQFTKIKAYLAVPGSSRDRITAQIVIGTPGTILAKMRAKEIDKKHIQVFVADEADLMISKTGLGEQTIKIKNQLNPDCQILLFSATYADDVRKFAEKVAKNSTKIHVKREDLSLDSIQQYYMNCENESNKYEVLTNIYGLLNMGQSMIYCHTVKTAKELSNKMRENGYTVSLLHGKDMSHDERDRVMEDFRAGTTSVLIATNVLARGIDVQQVTLVINYDIPLDRYGRPDPETYIHRIGRSGRFGRKGVAISFVHDDKSKRDLHRIATYYGKDIFALPADDLEVLEKKITAALGKT